jgi:hypothetical protein
VIICKCHKTPLLLPISLVRLNIRNVSFLLRIVLKLVKMTTADIQHETMVNSLPMIYYLFPLGCLVADQSETIMSI